MSNPAQHSTFALRSGLRGIACALALICALVIVTMLSAQAQTFSVLHTFTGGADGADPVAGVTLDQAGNLYGTAQFGGASSGFSGYGTVYKLTHRGSGWVFNLLHTFAGGSDGANPVARVIFGSNGTLYGTTQEGGSGRYGTVFNLRPFPTVCKTALCPWMETVLHGFEGYSTGDGGQPGNGDVTFDPAGDIYGTTVEGGSPNQGTVYELMPSGGGWTENLLYTFSGGSDGANPENNVIFDHTGNLYGTTYAGGSGDYGTVFQLTPSGPGWTQNVLYNFQNGVDGYFAVAGLIFDQSGNLYGSSYSGGQGGGGTVFKLTPSNGNWTYSLIYSFPGEGYSGPSGTLVMDGAGNLYGTTGYDGANRLGSVFRLTPSGNSWTYTSLHDFTGGSDGATPYCNVVFDAEGNLYGTAYGGGDLNCSGMGCGVVWEITP